MQTHLSIDRVRCGNYTTSRVEGSVYPSLCDGYGLLLHDFVNGNPVNIGHFVEFIYADDTSIREDHGASFQPPFSSFTVGCHSSSETDAGTSSAGSGDREWRNVQYEAKHLRFGGGRVSNHEHVDVTTNMSAVGKVLFSTTEKKEEYRLLDIIVATD